jgi:hypothetical protein
MKLQPSTILVVLAIASPSFAATPCTPQTTRGSWMYTCEGSLPAPTPTPTRMLGNCTSSKSAAWNCTGTVNLGGQILPQTLQGVATNLPNCTGTISYAHTLGGAPAGMLDIRFVIHDGGNAISGLPVNSGGVLSCALRRIASEED